ncbi:MAG: type II secretion system F family protein [Acidimicrobiales bacterium]
MSPAALLFLGLALLGAVVMVGALTPWRHTAPDLDEFLDDPSPSGFQGRLAEPVVPRLVRSLVPAVSHRLERLLPRQYLQNIDRQLAQAGLASKRRAAEHFAIQVGLAAAGVALLPFLPALSPFTRTITFVMLPVMGFKLPAARLKRAIRVRSDAMFKDLPDIVDMLAIAVEAGSGFEASLSMVCKNFASPLSDELAIALQEMELGLPRRVALQHLRERVDLDVVRMLVLALLQADALGIPIGRILKTQATEVRARRRAWAREKAAKMPIKILFPLVLFIFPPILALVLGPAVGSFSQLKG